MGRVKELAELADDNLSVFRRKKIWLQIRTSELGDGCPIVDSQAEISYIPQAAWFGYKPFFFVIWPPAADVGPVIALAA